MTFRTVGEGTALSRLEFDGWGMLTLRPTGLSPPIYRDQLDYKVIESDRAAGRIYEDLHALPDLRWFWSITVFVGYQRGLTTNGRRPVWSKRRRCFCH